MIARKKMAEDLKARVGQELVLHGTAPSSAFCYNMWCNTCGVKFLADTAVLQVGTSAGGYRSRQIDPQILRRGLGREGYGQRVLQGAL